jgi:hypothetical protein
MRKSPCPSSAVLLAESVHVLADMYATEVGDVVGWASHRSVAGPACLPRRLLVAQQVMASAEAEHDKTIRDLFAL